MPTTETARQIIIATPDNDYLEHAHGTRCLMETERKDACASDETPAPVYRYASEEEEIAAIRAVHHEAVRRCAVRYGVEVAFVSDFAEETETAARGETLEKALYDEAIRSLRLDDEEGWV